MHQPIPTQGLWLKQPRRRRAVEAVRVERPPHLNFCFGRTPSHPWRSCTPANAPVPAVQLMVALRPNLKFKLTHYPRLKGLGVGGLGRIFERLR